MIDQHQSYLTSFEISHSYHIFAQILHRIEFHSYIYIVHMVNICHSNYIAFINIADKLNTKFRTKQKRLLVCIACCSYIGWKKIMFQNFSYVQKCIMSKFSAWKTAKMTNNKEETAKNYSETKTKEEKSYIIRNCMCLSRKQQIVSLFPSHFLSWNVLYIADWPTTFRALSSDQCLHNVNTLE